MKFHILLSSLIFASGAGRHSLRCIFTRRQVSHRIYNGTESRWNFKERFDRYDPAWFALEGALSGIGSTC
jgi:hypothetical protein